jgi:hypothetical protein
MLFPVYMKKIRMLPAYLPENKAVSRKLSPAQRGTAGGFQTDGKFFNTSCI